MIAEQAVTAELVAKSPSPAGKETVRDVLTDRYASTGLVRLLWAPR